MLNEEQIIEELLLLNSSIVHDALRIENYSNQTLPNEIIPLQFENIIAGKVWTIKGVSSVAVSNHSQVTLMR